MGLRQSKNVDAVEAVARCRQRKQFMGAAAAARNAFAAAQSAYAVALKDTGAALSDYAHPHHDHDHDHDPSTVGAAAAAAASASSLSAPPSSSSFVAMAPPAETFLPPPPPLPDAPAPLQRAATMPDIPIAPPRKEEDSEAIAAAADAAAIGEDEYGDHDDGDDDDDDEEEEEEEEENSDRRRDYETLGLRTGLEEMFLAPTETASDVSVLQKPPPPPLPRLLLPQTKTAAAAEAAAPAPMAQDKGMETWDYYFDPQNSIPLPAPTQPEPEPTRPDRRGDLENKPPARLQPPLGARPLLMPEKADAELPPRRPQGTPKQIVLKTEKGKNIVPATATAAAAATTTAMVTAAAANSVQVLTKVDDYFLQASLGARDVSKMLEATRMHYHSNFVDGRGHIDHSTRIMRVITWNRSFKGLPQQDDAHDNFDTEECETHATVLDKMLAWEKKLYDEAKEGELMKIEYHRKLASLNQQIKCGARREVLERSKSAVVHMQTRCSVDRESMNATVAEINRLRDHQLYPKLVDLVEGMAKMWEVMFEHHRSQLRAIAECRAFDFALAPRETSEQHRQRTAQLRDSAREWHSSFEGLFAHQKDYIRSLKSWLSLNLVPIENGTKEEDSPLLREADPPIEILLREWHEDLDRLPHDLAKNAVHGFAEVMSSLLALQDDELKLKSECEDARKDLERKRWQFEDWQRRYAERTGAVPVSEGTESANPAAAAAAAAVVERTIIVEAAEMKLKEAEENHKRLCKQVRERSIGSLRTHLPELFRATSEFAFASCQMYKRLWSITQFRGQAEND